MNCTGGRVCCYGGKKEEGELTIVSKWKEVSVSWERVAGQNMMLCGVGSWM